MQNPTQRPVASASPLFPAFLLAGFECSTPINRSGVRLDELALTAHYRYVAADYRRLKAYGIHAARDGVRWNLVDRAGRLDFSSALPFVAAAESEGMTIIWDLFHYGYPDDLDPFADAFVERFATYCAAFARLLVRRRHGETGRLARNARFYTPVNEISFYSWAAGEVGLFAPFATQRGGELKRRLAQAAIRGIDAIRAVDPLARFVHCDPIVRVVAPEDAPWLHDDAVRFNEHSVCEGWDMLAGRLAPELGGSRDHLDIIGVNYYGVNQWEHTRPCNVLCDSDPRRVPFADLLVWLHRRYGATLLVTETSSCGDDRPRWLATIFEECLLARQAGVPVEGLCIYPVVGMADWETYEHVPMGLWERSEMPPDPRSPHRPSLATVRRLQRRARGVLRDEPRLRRRAAVTA